MGEDNFSYLTSWCEVSVGTDFDISEVSLAYYNKCKGDRNLTPITFYYNSLKFIKIH